MAIDYTGKAALLADGIRIPGRCTILTEGEFARAKFYCDGVMKAFRDGQMVQLELDRAVTFRAQVEDSLPSGGGGTQMTMVELLVFGFHVQH